MFHLGAGVLSNISSSGLPNAELANSFLHDLRAISGRLDTNTPFSIQNPYAYSSPEHHEKAQAANEVILGAIALANNAQPATPNRFVNHVREVSKKQAFYQGVAVATQFCDPIKGSEDLQKYLP